MMTAVTADTFSLRKVVPQGQRTLSHLCRKDLH